MIGAAARRPALLEESDTVCKRQDDDLSGTVCKRFPGTRCCEDLYPSFIGEVLVAVDDGDGDGVDGIGGSFSDRRCAVTVLQYLYQYWCYGGGGAVLGLCLVVMFYWLLERWWWSCFGLCRGNWVVIVGSETGMVVVSMAVAGWGEDGGKWRW
ncbi:Hypothetical predicted protein [Olea europaea subsp. europaea]|uniref:Uncharacterized protein n=1 Tax=Olea europaea subsp. europaea TaxID=158383 RepID=A0A8S0PIN1_OLEEU|nr:Hypothetical predicted protein [Olea europaea subsp. europaea]